MANLKPLTEYDFGADVAEHDDNLEHYFLRHPAYTAVISDESDLILGAKGTGKSAIALYLANPDAEIDELSDCLVIPAFNIRGSTLFRRLITDAEERPLDESAFRDLFLAYIGGLAGNSLLAAFEHASTRDRLRSALERTGLLVIGSEVTARSVWRTVLTRFRPKIEASVDHQGSPTIAITPDVTDAPPPVAGYDVSLEALEEVLEHVYDVLEELDHRCWVVFDRLDEAFSDAPDVEIAALRGLLRAQLDAGSLGSRLRVKSFLRLDVFDRITKDRGFVNATHLRTIRIRWRSESIFELIALRLSHGLEVRERYADLTDEQTAKRLCQLLLPVKMDGVRALVWLLLVTVDATREYNPRNVLTLLRRARLEQLEIQRRQGVDGHALSHRALSVGFSHLSSARLEDTIFAESPIARSYIERLRGRRTIFTLAQLSVALDLEGEDLDAAIHTLRYVGFLRFAEGQYIMPALFRPAMFVSVYGAESRLGTAQWVDRDDQAENDAVLPQLRSEIPDDASTAEPASDSAGFKRKRKRARPVRTGRDEYIPSSQTLEIENEVDHQLLLDREIGHVAKEDADPAEQAIRAESDRRNLEEALAAARQLAEEGDPLIGFRLLYPARMTQAAEALSLGADLAFAAADPVAMRHSVTLLNLAPRESAGLRVRRAALLFALGEGDDALSVLAGIESAHTLVAQRHLVAFLASAPDRELAFWENTMPIVTRRLTPSRASMLTREWHLLAASRVIAMWRHYWNNTGPDVWTSGTIINRIWSTERLRDTVQRKAFAWVARYADAPSAARPVVRPYQSVSIASVLDYFGGMPEDLRGRFTARVAETVASMSEAHRSKFAQWGQYSELFDESLRAAEVASSVHSANVAGGLDAELATSIGRTIADALRLHGQGDPHRLPLSRLGLEVKRAHPTFQYRALGYRSFLAIAIEISKVTSLFRIHQEIGGHPYAVATR